MPYIRFAGRGTTKSGRRSAGNVVATIRFVKSVTSDLLHRSITSSRAHWPAVSEQFAARATISMAHPSVRGSKYDHDEEQHERPGNQDRLHVIVVDDTIDTIVALAQEHATSIDESRRGRRQARYRG